MHVKAIDWMLNMSNVDTWWFCYKCLLLLDFSRSIHLLIILMAACKYLSTSVIFIPTAQCSCWRGILVWLHPSICPPPCVHSVMPTVFQDHSAMTLQWNFWNISHLCHVCFTACTVLHKFFPYLPQIMNRLHERVCRIEWPLAFTY